MRRIAPGAAMVSAVLALAACTPIPPPRQQAAVRPPPTIVPPPPAAPDWRDVPETPGGWSYAQNAAGSTASFGQPGGAVEFAFSCDTARRTVTMSRPGTAAGSMTIRTSYSVQAWPATPQADGRIAVTLAAADPFLDRIAFSRGRFTVDDSGAATLVLPAWAEPARVIEDCRG